MKISEIPITKFLKISFEKDHLKMPFSNEVTNHIETVHAGALFSLAETASGVFLEEQFSDYKDKVIAVLRRAEVKYSLPAQSNIIAKSSLNHEDKIKLINDLNSKGRAIIKILVSLTDQKESVVFKGTYEWFLKMK